MARKGWKTVKADVSKMVVGAMIGIDLGGSVAHTRGNAILAVRVLSGTIIRATEKAVQIEVYGQKNTTIWLPKSILMVEIPTDEHILSYYRSNGMLETPNFVLASWFRPDAWQSSVFARVEPEFLTA